MRKQWFAAGLCMVLLVVVGLLWSRIRQLERTVELLKLQRTPSSTVAWQNPKQADSAARKKQIFKLIDTPPAKASKSEVGVPWDVERAMIGGARRTKGPSVRKTPDETVTPSQPDSK